MDYFTPLQNRIYEKLSEGGIKTFAELLGVFEDELSGLSSLRTTISLMRKQLRINGEDIVNVNGTGYYLIQRMTSGE